MGLTLWTSHCDLVIKLLKCGRDSSLFFEIITDLGHNGSHCRRNVDTSHRHHVRLPAEQQRSRGQSTGSRDCKTCVFGEEFGVVDLVQTIWVRSGSRENIIPDGSAAQATRGEVSSRGVTSFSACLLGRL